MSEGKVSYMGGIMAAFCVGMFVAAVTMFTTAHYILGAIALGLCVLPFMVRTKS